MKNIVQVLVVFALLLFSACRSANKIVYLHDVPLDTLMAVDKHNVESIQPHDLIDISVESLEPLATTPFNQETNRIVATSSGKILNNGTSSEAVPGYQVDEKGDIVFPFLGTIHVGGLTFEELQQLIEQRLSQEGYIKDPHVTVKLKNYKVSLLGEVKNPGAITVNGRSITIFEALSRCGDITTYGVPTNLTVIREENGHRTIGNIDLTSKDLFESPYYHLHQNDVVYVEPNAKRKRSANHDMRVFTYLTFALSTFNALLLIVNRYASTKS